MNAFLGIDIGGTKTAFRLRRPRVPEAETVLRWPRGGPAAELAAFEQALAGLAAEAVTAVGVSFPATLDERGRVVAWPNRPGWTGVDLPELLARALPGAAVRLADDGDLATVAEARAAGGTDLLYVGIGTGVGGGLFLGGGLLRGRYGPVAEIGHIVVDPAGPRCRCGRCGCVQAIASGPATLDRASLRRGARIDAAGLGAAYTAGRPWAARTVTETAEALALMVVAVSELVRPPLVRIGGGFGCALAVLAPAVATALRALARAGHPLPAVEPAVHGPGSSLAGAVLLAENPTLLTERDRVAQKSAFVRG